MPKQRPRDVAIGRRQHEAQLLGNSFRTDSLDSRRQGTNRLGRSGFNVKSQSAGKANRPQEPKMILPKSLGRQTNRPHLSGRQIVAPADKVDHPILDRIKEQPVYREIPPSGIFLRRGEANAAGRRPSSYFPSARNVATSTMLFPLRTRITPNAAPTAWVDMNSSRTRSGGASVATSQSFASNPRIESRTHPPAK